MMALSRADIRTEVAIVGGGVAGSSLGSALAGAGLDVVIMERERHFRDRVRGEGIHPWGVAEADQLGLLPALKRAGATELPYLQFFEFGEPAGRRIPLTEAAPSGFGEWSVYHPALQNALLAHAEQNGAAILRPAEATVCEVESGKPVLMANMPDGARTVRSELVVAADGRLSGARRWIGAATQRDPTDHHLIGGCLLAGGCPAGDMVHMGNGCGTYSFVVPRDGGTARAYLVAQLEICEPMRRTQDLDGFVDEIAKTLPEGTFEGAQQAGPLAFFPGTNEWADQLTGPGIVLIGDAAMATDPSIGHGLSLVFRDARELRDLLLDAEDWQVAIEEFASRKKEYQAPIRCAALWLTQLRIDTGPEADARRQRYAEAREVDPSNGGYRDLVAAGPDGLATDEAARRRWFGEEFSGRAPPRRSP